jgi:hypothetical protein
MEFALNINGDYLQSIEYYRTTDMSSPGSKAICAQAQDLYRDDVEGKQTICHNQEVF